MSVQFFILGTHGKRKCEATDSHKAAQILRLMFHNSKGYVVEGDRISFAQNMTMDEAAIEHGFKVAAPVQSMEVLPAAPKAAAVKPKKKAAKKVVKAKKTTLKSKVVIKNHKNGKKPTPKKTAVKVKPKTAKPKVKAPKKPIKAKKPATKAKGKKR